MSSGRPRVGVVERDEMDQWEPLKEQMASIGVKVHSTRRGGDCWETFLSL